MILQPRLRLNDLNPRQIYLRIRHRLRMSGRNTAIKLRYPHIWLGVACLILVIILLATHPELGTASSPYLTYDQVGAASVLPVTGPQSSPRSGAPCSTLSEALRLCSPPGR